MQGLDEFVRSTMEEWNAPGFAVAAVRGDEVMLAQGYGKRNVEDNLDANAQTLFAICSCTKAVTCTALGILADEGKLDWDRPVREYLPDFRVHDTYATDHMTPRDLVTHRSGLPRHDLMWYWDAFTRQEIFDRLRYLQPSKSFREAYQYNNVMYMTAGVLLERIAGCTWEAFVRDRILMPLDMNRSNTDVKDSQKDENFAQPYREKDGKIERVPFCNLSVIGPAGSINSSVEEMTRWLILNLNGGRYNGRQIISEDALKRVHAPHTATGFDRHFVPMEFGFDEVGYGLYGLGWQVNHYRGRLNLSHSGGIDGFRAYVSLLPSEKIGVVALANREMPLPFIVTSYLFDRLLDLEPLPWHQRHKDKQAADLKAESEKETKTERIEGTQPSHPLADYAGTYEHPGYGKFVITSEESGLKARFNDALNFTGEHIHYDVFEWTDEVRESKRRATFSSDTKGRVDQFSIALEDAVAPIVFTRVSEEI